MFCTECGKELNTTARFCGKCGAPVKVSAEDRNSDLNQNNKRAQSNISSVGVNQQKQFDPGLVRSQKSQKRSTTEISSNNNGLVQAYKRRQEDTGWGWALAHAIPIANTFVAIFYAISRRTITPLLIYFVSCFVAGGIVAIFSYELSQDNGFATLIAILLAPFTIKIGISKARRFAKKRLSQDPL